MSLLRVDKPSQDVIAAAYVVPDIHTAVMGAIYNAIDASARVITARVNLTRLSFTVDDDGAGIDAEALFEHIGEHPVSTAASRSYGRRGDFLSALTSLGRVELESRTAGHWASHRKVMERGRVLFNTVVRNSCRATAGTSLVVRDLFKALAVRQKKLQHSESARAKVAASLQEACGNLALLWPTLTLTVHFDGDSFRSIRVDAVELYRDRLVQVFGEILGNSVEYVSHACDRSTLVARGYFHLVQHEAEERTLVETQAFAQAAAHYQFVFLNNQWLPGFHRAVAKLITRAVKASQAGVPVFVLKLQAPVDEFELVSDRGDCVVHLKRPHELEQFVYEFIESFVQKHGCNDGPKPSMMQPAKMTHKQRLDVNKVNHARPENENEAAAVHNPSDESLLRDAWADHCMADDACHAQTIEDFHAFQDPATQWLECDALMADAEGMIEPQHLLHYNNEMWALEATVAAPYGYDYAPMAATNMTSAPCATASVVCASCYQPLPDAVPWSGKWVPMVNEPLQVEQYCQPHAVPARSSDDHSDTASLDDNSDDHQLRLTSITLQPDDAQLDNIFFTSAHMPPIQANDRKPNQQQRRQHPGTAIQNDGRQPSSPKNQVVEVEGSTSPEAVLLAEPDGAGIRSPHFPLRSLGRRRRQLPDMLTRATSEPLCVVEPCDDVGLGLHQVKLHRSLLATLQVFKQVDRKFIVGVTQPSDTNPVPLLLCIDQHAADERVRLEELEAQLFGSDGQSRNLDVAVHDPPLELLLTPHEQQILKRHVEHVHSWGFECWLPQDNNAKCRQYQLIPPREELVALVTTPKIDHRVAGAEDFREFLQLLAGYVNVHVPEQVRPPALTRYLHSRACRSAIKFGDWLSLGQCKAIVNELSRCQLPFQCAHGRPSVVPLALVTDT